MKVHDLKPAPGSRRAPGSVTLAHGYWPKDTPMVERVGGGFDLILSKNTLKKGYVKPERRTDRRTRSRSIAIVKPQHRESLR